MMQSLLRSKTLLIHTCESGGPGCTLVLNPVVDYLRRVRRNRWSCASISSLAEGTFMYNSLPGCKCIHRCLHCAVKCGLAGKQAVALSLQAQHPHSSSFQATTSAKPACFCCKQATPSWSSKLTHARCDRSLIKQAKQWSADAMQQSIAGTDGVEDHLLLCSRTVRLLHWHTLLTVLSNISRQLSCSLSAWKN